MAQKQQSYDPGTWGCYTSDLNGKIMEGFQIDRPQIDDICGEYNIVFAASFTPHNEDNKETPLRWHVRQEASGSLLIVRHPQPAPGIGTAAYCVKALLFTDQSEPIYQYFQYGYYAFGYGAGIDGEPNNGCSNCLPMRCLGLGGRGHLYVISQRKAFPMVPLEKSGDSFKNGRMEEEEEGGGDGEAIASVDTAKYAEDIYNTRHYSFLCRELSFSCVVSTLITQYIGNDVRPKPEDYPPLFYAEPGDIWMDTKLSDDNTRTYLLARRCKDNCHHNHQRHNLQSKIISGMPPKVLMAYLISPPRIISPIVNWMHCHPAGETPPRALMERMRRFFSSQRSNLIARTRNANARRRNNNHHGEEDAGQQQGGVVTRSRARRQREETEQRVLRPRR